MKKIELLTQNFINKISVAHAAHKHLAIIEQL